VSLVRGRHGNNLLIAAHARPRGLTRVTHKVRDVQRVADLRVKDRLQ
jgi:predicted nucleic acid-binding protein